MHSNLAISAMAGGPQWVGIYALSHEDRLWRRLRDNDDHSARDELLDLHMPYARVVAGSYYAKRMHDEIDFAEYLRLASLGMSEALDRFAPDVGVIFKIFAARRMHDTILEGVRRLREQQQIGNNRAHG